MFNRVVQLTILPILRKFRAQAVKKINPKENYSLMPISGKFGYDRGTPVDRYYIEKFMEMHKETVKGCCLEVHDDAYIKKYGETHVTQADVVDIDTNNKLANIYADLSKADVIADNTYDTVILTQTLGLIPDHEKAVGHLYRMLKPGGTLLLTVSTMGPYITNGHSFWRYTVRSIPYLLEKYFPKENVKVEAYGNVLTGQGFWVGMAAEEFTPEQLNFKDDRYPVIISAIATK